MSLYGTKGSFLVRDRDVAADIAVGGEIRNKWNESVRRQIFQLIGAGNAERFQPVAVDHRRARMRHRVAHYAGTPYRNIHLQRREGRRLENAAFLVLMRAELAALRQVFLGSGVGHQRVAFLLAVGLAGVFPDVHHLVQLPNLGGRIEDGLAAVLHLRGMAVLLVKLEPRRKLVVVQRVDAQIENHVPSSKPSIAFVACIARRARSSGGSFCETGTSRLIGMPAGSAFINPLRSRPPSPGNSRSERAWRMISCMSVGRSARASQSWV